MCGGARESEALEGLYHEQPKRRQPHVKALHLPVLPYIPVFCICITVQVMVQGLLKDLNAQVIALITVFWTVVFFSKILLKGKIVIALFTFLKNSKISIVGGKKVGFMGKARD